MTENEEKLFNNLMEHNSAYYGYELSKGEIKTVLQAFEQLKQYRAIGTVERFRFLQEVCDLTGDELEHIANSMIELKNYRAIGTIEELKALKEKSVPKKPNIQNCCANCVYAEGYTGFDDFYCNAKKCSIRAEHYDCVKFKKLDWND